MKKLIFALLLLLALPIGSFADVDFSENVSSYTIDHFSFIVPADWSLVDNDGVYSFTAPDSSPYANSMFAINENYYPDAGNSYTVEMMYVLSMDGLVAGFGYPKYSTEYINIGLNKASLVEFEYNGVYLAALAIYNSDSILTSTFMSPQMSKEEVRETLLSFSDHISYSSALNLSQATYGVVRKGVNVRFSPDSSSSKIGSFDANEKIIVTVPFYTPKWHQVAYGDGVGYVSANYIDLDE